MDAEQRGTAFTRAQKAMQEAMEGLEHGDAAAEMLLVDLDSIGTWIHARMDSQTLLADLDLSSVKTASRTAQTQAEARVDRHARLEDGGDQAVGVALRAVEEQAGGLQVVVEQVST